MISAIIESGTRAVLPVIDWQQVMGACVFLAMLVVFVLGGLIQRRRQ